MPSEHRAPEQEVCPKCKTPVVIAPGIGPYCPNKTCDVIDNLKGEPVKLQSHPASKERDYAARLRGWIGHPACPAQSVQEDLRACADELERLTREWDELTVRLAELARGWSEAADWKAERDRLRVIVAEQQRNCSCPYGDCSTCEKAKAALSGEPTSPSETEARQAPIVHVMIKDGEAAYTLIYSPGLPDGQHDLYCEPEAIAPMMRDEPLCQMSPAAADVIAERLRQLTKEGWTPEHDNEHDMGELAEAAACYALKSAGNEESLFERWWPWSSSWWKPKGRRRDLVRAGALILAEIERLDRKTPEKARED